MSILKRHMFQLSLSLYFLLGIFTFLFITPVNAFAQENVLRLSPAFIDVEVKDPLEEKEVIFTLENRSDKPLSVELFTLDFNQKDEYGTTGFLGREAGNYTYGLSSFISFENTNLEFKAGEKKNIPVTITNRQDLTPGGHYAAVIAKVKGEREGNAIVSPAVSGLIYLTKIGGERVNVSLKSIDYSPAISFSYPATAFLSLQNDGNVHIVPYGTADIYDMLGRRIYKGIINEPSVKVLPQSIRRIPIYFKKQAFLLPISVNTLRIEGRDSLYKTKFQTQEVFVYINLWFIGGLVLVIGIVTYILKKRRSKKSND